MAKKSVLDRAQKAVVSAAKTGAEGVKDAASSALGARHLLPRVSLSTGLRRH